MSQSNILANSLLTCSKCIKVLKYYDYLSHIEICNDNHSNGNNNVLSYNNVNDNDNDDNDNDDNHNDDIEIQNDNQNYDYNYNDDYNYNYNNNNINNIYSRINIENLYNPLLNISSNQVQNIDTSSIDNGLGIENLSLYSTKIEITEDSYCVICMNTYEYNKGNSFYLMKCMHSFCDECSKKWFDFKSVCPLCKTNMKKI